MSVFDYIPIEVVATYLKALCDGDTHVPDYPVVSVGCGNGVPEYNFKELGVSN